MDFLLDLLIEFAGPGVYFLVFLVLLLCGFGLPIPEDITLIAGGTMVYYGVANFYPMLVVCMFGVMMGDSAMWFLGNHFGHRILRIKWFAKLLPPERIESARNKLLGTEAPSFFSRFILFFARFMPGLRAPIFFSAGMFKIPFLKFFFWDFLAALLSVPAILWATFAFGNRLDHLLKNVKNAEGWIIGLFVFVILMLILKSRINRGRNTKTSLI